MLTAIFNSPEMLLFSFFHSRHYADFFKDIDRKSIGHYKMRRVVSLWLFTIFIT
jgi:hypothetical protein